MEHFLITLFFTIFIATTLNIIFKRFGISHIIGYILTGVIIGYAFHFNGVDVKNLETIGEFGIVFLMFTIGLEMSLSKIKRMKDILLINGFLQVVISTILIYIIAYFIFKLSIEIALIVSLAFSLSSTAIVLPYLKSSKDIYTPYGEKSTAILIFQDLAVIPILLLISFLTNDNLSIQEVLLKTVISALIITVLMFFVGKHLITWLLKFASDSRIDEIFIGAVLSIVVGASLLAEYLGFTYSLGAFLAGVIIADTKFNIKVESDISNFKDLLLGTFFFAVGTKIDIVYFLENIHIVLGIFILVMIIKALVVYLIIRRDSDADTSIKTAIALCQIGEFSFVILTLASNKNIIDENTASFLMLVSIISIILTPFLLNKISQISALFAKDLNVDNIKVDEENHIIVCGFSILGRVVARDLTLKEIPFIIVSNDFRHVQFALRMGYRAYLGDLQKISVLEALKVEKSSSIVLTNTDIKNKILICDEILKFYPEANIIISYKSMDEKRLLGDLNIKKFVHIHEEVGRLLVEDAITYSKIKQEQKS